MTSLKQNINSVLTAETKEQARPGSALSAAPGWGKSYCSLADIIEITMFLRTKMFPRNLPLIPAIYPASKAVRQ